MNDPNARVAKLMRLEMVALGCAVDDIEAGRYTPEEREHLASGLDTLAATLREQNAPVVVEAELDTEVSAKPRIHG